MRLSKISSSLTSHAVSALDNNKVMAVGKYKVPGIPPYRCYTGIIEFDWGTIEGKVDSTPTGCGMWFYTLEEWMGHTCVMAEYV